MAEAAVAEFRELGDRLSEGAALLMLARVRYWQGDRAAADAIFDEGMALLEGEPPGPELVDAYAQKTGGLMMMERSRECIEWATRTIELAGRLDAPSERYRALELRGLSRLNLGDTGGLDDVRESLRGVRQLGLSNQTAVGLINLGDMIWYTDGPEAGLEVHRESIEFAERRGLITTSMWARAETTWTLHELGQWDELLRVADEVLDWDKDRTQISRLVEPWKALVQLYRGDLASAQGALSLLDRARAAGDPQVVIPALTVAAMVELEGGNREIAAALIRERVELVGRQEASFAIAHTEAARVLVAAGELGLLEELRRQDDFPLRRTRLLQATSGALLAEAQERTSDALGLYLDAKDGWSSFGNPFETAFAEMGAGRCLLGLGRRDEATGHLRSARETFARLGAVRLTAETDDLLAVATAKTS